MKSILMIPVAVWLVSGLFFSAAAWHEQVSPARADTWAKWDSYQYLSIATDGYKVWREPRMAQNHLVEWRGNAAWFPLFPILIRTVARMGVNPEASAHGLSEFFWLMTLVVLWNFYLRPNPSGPLALALAAVFPGAIYDHASFSISLTLFLMLVYIHTLTEKRYIPAGLAGVLIGTAYTSGLYMTLAVIAWGFSEKSDRLTRKIPFWVAALSPVAGAGLVFLMQHAETGYWDSFFRVFEFHRYNGWSWIRLKQMIYIPTIFHPTEFAKELVIAQSASVLAAVSIILCFSKRLCLSAVHNLLLITALVFWILPHVSPYRLSWYRAEALLLPVVVLMAGLPKRWQVIFLAIWTPLAWFMALEFFRGVLV